MLENPKNARKLLEKCQKTCPAKKKNPAGKNGFPPSFFSAQRGKNADKMLEKDEILILLVTPRFLFSCT